jgi:hypothetical protein
MGVISLLLFPRQSTRLRNTIDLGATYSLNVAMLEPKMAAQLRR